jgi:hypothetical protein
MINGYTIWIIFLLLNLFIVPLIDIDLSWAKANEDSALNLSSKKVTPSRINQANKASHFEIQIIKKQLQQKRWQESINPHGKIITKIHFIRLPVFITEEELGDWSLWLNHFHSLSRQNMIQKELRIYENHEWNQDDALESERNLRRLGIFTLVRVVPLQTTYKQRKQGKQAKKSATQILSTLNTTTHKKESNEGSNTPSIHTSSLVVNQDDSTSSACPHPKGCLEVAVVSRDLWSLRLESAFEYNAGVLNYLKLSLTERNFLGQRITVRAPMTLSPFTHTWGLEMSHRRWGPDLSLSVGISGTWNRDTSIREGGALNIQLSHPLYHLDQTWSWSAGVQKSKFLNRLTQGSQVITQQIDPNNSAQSIPIQWNSSFQSLAFSIGRQWPGKYQHILSLGLAWQEFTHELESSIPQSIQNLWRSRYMPPQQVEAGPTLSYSVLRRTYVALYNVSSFGVREDLRIGPVFTIQQSLSMVDQFAYLSSLSISWRSLWAKRGFISFGTSLSIRAQLVANQTQARLNPEYQPILNQSQGWINRSVRSGWLIVSPPLAKHGGRFVHRVSLLNQWYTIQNQSITLGGSNGLRGYASNQFFLFGGDRLQNNIEYRSTPLLWSSLHLGGVIFYDSGSVHYNWESLVWKQSLGIGTRILFPQLNRSVFRIDFAMPLNENGWQVLLSAGSGQSFAVMPWED